MRRIVQAILLSILSLTIALSGVLVVRANYENDLGKWDFNRIESYQSAREDPDIRMDALQMELRRLEASVQGSVVLMFDQCEPNVYEVAYAHLSEFEMAGSVIFRDRLPGDEGVITREQWREMQQDGWAAVLSADQNLLATLEEEGYTERLRAYVQNAQERFVQRGLRAPVAYEFSKGEYSEETVSVLMEEGFAAFSSVDTETSLCGENAAIFQQFYICSDPRSPLLQFTVEAIKNTADVLVIKTRYVGISKDITKDIFLDKFRGGMLNSLSVYRRIESLRIESIESAFSNYRAELDKLAEVERQKELILTEMGTVQKELEQIWQIYRS